jgi:hypothetical protein
MNALPKKDMLEATRLTREGRLEEAMAVLRQTLAGASPSPARSNFRSNASQNLSVFARAILDMTPAPAGSGRTRTPPGFNNTRVASRRGSVSPPRIPEALRGFLDHIGHHERVAPLAAHRLLYRPVRGSNGAPMPTRQEAALTSSIFRAAIADRRCLSC